VQRLPSPFIVLERFRPVIRIRRIVGGSFDADGAGKSECPLFLSPFFSLAVRLRSGS
jgi:hypothetical protein